MTTYGEYRNDIMDGPDKSQYNNVHGTRRTTRIRNQNTEGKLYHIQSHLRAQAT